MGAPIDCNSNGPQAVIELRPADRFSKLSFNIAQANNSQSSNASLIVDVIANADDKLDNHAIPFNKIQSFSENIADVGAVKIEFTVPCPQNSDEGSVVAVLENMTVTS